MFTRCTHCDAVLRITAKQLSMARGAVRCGKCSEVFNALGNLSETLPDADTPTPDPTPDVMHKAQPEPTSAPEDAGHTGEREPTWSLADEIFRRERSTRTQPDRTPPPASFQSSAAPDVPPLAAADDSGPPSVAERDAITSEAEALKHTLRDLEEQARREPSGEPSMSTAPAGERAGGATSDQVDDALRRIMPLLDSLGADRPHQDVTSPAPAKPAPAPSEAETPTDPHLTLPEPGRVQEPPEPRTASGKFEHLDTMELPRVLQEDVARLQKAKHGSLSRWVYGLSSVLLLLLLAVQHAWFMPDDVVNRYPQARKLVAELCVRTGCKLGQTVDAERMKIASRDVRIHPKYEGALLVTAALFNTAYDVQPFPRIQFVLYSVSGKTIASRIFGPDEYLSTDVAHELGMVPRQPVQIALELLAPEEAAVSFEFKFLP